MRMIACLPMYDWTELRQYYDDFWSSINTALTEKNIAAPLLLTRDKSGDVYWLSPELLLGQTCGYPLATSLAGKVQYVATPNYLVEGCNGSSYSSAIVVRAGEGKDLTQALDLKFAYNSTGSWSGFRIVQREFGAPEQFFGSMVESGGHRQSGRMVASGEADIAAMDAVCWHYFQRFEPQVAAKLRVIHWTASSPSLPFITSLNTSAATLAALREVLENISVREENSPEPDLQILRQCAVIDVAQYRAMGVVV